MKIRSLALFLQFIFCSVAVFAQNPEPALGKMDYQIKIAYSKPQGGDTTKKFYTQSHTLYFGKRSALNIERLPTSISKDPNLITLKKDTIVLTKASIAGNAEYKSAYDQSSLLNVSSPDILNSSFKEYNSNGWLSVKNNAGYSVVQNDTLPVIKWKISQQEREIMGVKVTKATGEFRGREYTVWFAKSIPVPAGPWKLNGLPGLILEAADAKGEILIQLNLLEIPFKYAIAKPQVQGKVVKQSEFIEAQQKKNEQTARMLRASNGLTQSSKPNIQTIRLVNLEIN